MERGRQGRLPAVQQRSLIARALLIGVLALGLVAGARDLSRSWFFPLERSQLDLRVLYCGGRAANAGANPYALEPIRTCEHEFPTRLMIASPNLAFPFTLPGYDLGPIELLARLPLGAASTMFVALTLLALAGAIVLVSRTLGMAWWIPAAALTLSVGFTSLPLGQPGALELLALAATGWALASGRDRWAGILAVLTLFEPHVGGFVVVAVAVLVPRARLALAIGCAVLIALALTWSTFATQIAYLTVFVPGQAASEVHSPEQYGLTYLLALLGVSDGIALAIGSAWTLAMLIAAVPLARACSARGGRA
ncbi:MAG TPA: glycosyltransferase 87 family protein, partial [Candidatus Elarobacter sp.]|nr:glycosyltransferase 87 family protein [Candidatus Elarobacter sp.]